MPLYDKFKITRNIDESKFFGRVQNIVGERAISSVLVQNIV